MITRCQRPSGRPAPLVRAAVGVSVLLLATSPVPDCATRPAGSTRDHAGQCGTPRNATPAELKEMANDMEIAGQTRLWFPHPPATRLRDLINRPSESSCDLSAGTFNVVHYRQWSSPDFPPALRDVVQWHADDRSGAALTTTYPRGTVEVTSDYWLPGDNLRLSPGDPFADSESGFRDLLVGSPDHTDPQAALRGLALLASWHSPRQAGRTTALTVLDHIRGFTFYSRVTDRAGRSGIGITAADQDSRDLLILHPTTGEVLAYEGAVRTPIGWQVGFYRLYLTHTHSPDRYWEPHHATNKPPPRSPQAHPRSSWPGPAVPAV